MQLVHHWYCYSCNTIIMNVIYNRSKTRWILLGRICADIIKFVFSNFRNKHGILWCIYFYKLPKWEQYNMSKLMKRRRFLSDKITNHHNIQNDSLTDEICEKRYIRSLRSLCCVFYLRGKRWTSSKTYFQRYTTRHHKRLIKYNIRGPKTRFETQLTSLVETLSGDVQNVCLISNP